MGLTLLRINKMQEKWRLKIAQALVATRKSSHHGTIGTWTRRYAMFILPFITTMREGVEAVVFVGGVSLGYPATAFPIPVITGILAGLAVGLLMYKGGNAMSIRVFMIASTCVLYLIAAGMLSKSVWSLQYHVFAAKVGSDVAEVGSGPGSYDPKETVWHVNCCNPEIDNGWDVFNAILGWENTATYGSVISYNVYWIFIMAVIACLLYEERTGSLPFRNQIRAGMLKVPGLRTYLKRKEIQAVSSEEVEDAMREIQGDAEDAKPVD